MSESEEPRQLLELRATESRQRLEDRLDLLNERGHRVIETARAAVRPPIALILAAAVGVAALLFVVQRTRARRREQSRFARLARVLESPRTREKSFVVRGLERAGTSLVAFGAQRIARQGLDNWLEAQEAAKRPSGFRLT